MKKKTKLMAQANGNTPRSIDEKTRMILDASKHYGKFLEAIGFDWKKDGNSRDTPMRVAKAWVNDLVMGSVSAKPKITKFPASAYNGIVFDGDIEVISMCSHHNLPFVGVAHVAYIPKKGQPIVGLSKLNRVVDWYARRPQLQEELTLQIHDEIKSLIANDGVAVYVSCKHQCCSNRGIKHKSTMVTAQYSGHFFQNDIGTRNEFLAMIANLKQ